MIEEERAKQTGLGPGNLSGCSKMAPPDGRSHAGILVAENMICATNTELEELL